METPTKLKSCLSDEFLFSEYRFIIPYYIGMVLIK